MSKKRITVLLAEDHIELDTPAVKVASDPMVILSYPRSHKNPLE